MTQRNHIGEIFGFSSYGTVCSLEEDIDYIGVIVDEKSSNFCKVFWVDTTTSEYRIMSIHYDTITKYGLSLV